MDSVQKGWVQEMRKRGFGQVAAASLSSIVVGAMLMLGTGHANAFETAGECNDDMLPNAIGGAGAGAGVGAAVGSPVGPVGIAVGSGVGVIVGGAGGAGATVAQCSHIIEGKAVPANDGKKGFNPKPKQYR